MVKEAFKIKWVRVQEQLPYSELRDCVDRLGLPKVWLQESERFAQVPDRLRYVAGRRLRLEYLRMYGFLLGNFRRWKCKRYCILNQKKQPFLKLGAKKNR